LGVIEKIFFFADPV